jgi:5-methyltetrahydrofolate--homocysteine methyltransferase
VSLFATYADADWSRLERDWTAWWNGELKRPLLVLSTRKRIPGVDRETSGVWETLTRFAPDAPVDRLLDWGQGWLDAMHYYGDAYPNWWPNFGPGIVSAFLGSRAEYQPRTTWFHPVGVESLAELSVAYDARNVWWQQVQAVTAGAIARWGEQVAIGFTDMGGNLDILASLRGTQNLLLDVLDAPDEVARLVPQITRLWLQYYASLNAMISRAGHGSCNWGPCWFPTNGYFLQSDFSYMISPAAFARYVLPDLHACCESMDCSIYHLDGKGALKHLDALLSLPKLRAIQWQPGDGQPRAEGWLEVLQRIRAGGKLCQVYVEREGAFRIARELGGRGIVMEILEDLTDREAEEFLEAFWHEFAPGEPVPGSRRHAHA